MVNLIFMSRRLMTEFQGTVIFMALELLRRQNRHLRAEKADKRNGRPRPLTLSTERQAHHDLESFLWVLVYDMMIHRYNSLTHDTDRTEYKETLDSYFGHGSATIILDKHIAMVYSAQARVGEDRVSGWFPDPHERKFFIRCMTLIAENDRKEEEEEEEEEEEAETFEGEISAKNPHGDRVDDESDSPPDEDAEDQSGTYKPRGADKRVQKLVVGLRPRPPVITYKSVLTLLKKSLKGL